MGKYDEDLAKFDKLLEREITPIEYFLCKIANELAENNRVIRQGQAIGPGEIIPADTNVDKA
jgi:hypothetical protein